MIDPRSVICPECHAAAGARCTRRVKDGSPLYSRHYNDAAAMTAWSLQDAIARNRARHAKAEPRRDDGLKAYSVNVLVVPPNYEIKLGLATVHEEKRTIYGTSLADAKKRAGIQ